MNEQQSFFVLFLEKEGCQPPSSIPGVWFTFALSRYLEVNTEWSDRPRIIRRRVMLLRHQESFEYAAPRLPVLLLGPGGRRPYEYGRSKLGSPSITTHSGYKAAYSRDRLLVFGEEGLCSFHDWKYLFDAGCFTIPDRNCESNKHGN